MREIYTTYTPPFKHGRLITGSDVLFVWTNTEPLSRLRAYFRDAMSDEENVEVCRTSIVWQVIRFTWPRFAEEGEDQDRVPRVGKNGVHGVEKYLVAE